MKIKKPVSAPETQRKIKRSYLTIATVAAAVIVMALPVYADDPLATINALSDFVFSAIKAIGAILLGFGIVQIGLALKSHDAGQRAQLLQIGRQFAAMLRNNQFCRLLQRTRAAVIPQSLPRLEQLLFRRVGQRIHVGIARKKTFIIRNDRLRARLLEHDLGNPDSISVLCVPPRQVAMPGVIPRKD